MSKLERYFAGVMVLGASLLAACGSGEATPAMAKPKPVPQGSPVPVPNGTETSSPPVGLSQPTRELDPATLQPFGGDIPVTMTPERDEFGVYISKKLKDLLPQEDFYYMAERIGAYLDLFPCRNLHELRIATMDEMGQNRTPGTIYLNPEAVKATAKQTKIKTSDIVASDVVVLTAEMCYEAKHSAQTFEFNDGTSMTSEPGLEMTITSSQGEPHKNNVISRAVAIGLAALSFGKEPFVTFSRADYYSAQLTKGLITDLESAQTLNKIKDEGDFVAFTAYALGIDKKEVAPDDVKTVIGWYDEASSINDDGQFNTLIDKVINGRRTRQKIKTNQNIQPDTMEGLTHKLADIKHQRSAGMINQEEAARERRKTRDRIWILKRTKQLAKENRAGKEAVTSWLQWMKDRHGAEV